MSGNDREAADDAVVVTDANVLINLCQVNRLGFLGRLGPLRFVVPTHVLAEVRIAAQRRAVEDAVQAGELQVILLDEIEDLVSYVELQRYLGDGEAACLVLAQRRGWRIASDEGGRFRKEVEARVGPERILRTRDLYVRAIRGGVLTLAEADADIVRLAQLRFRMDDA